MKLLLEGWCPSAGWGSVGAREGAVPVRVAWTAVFTMTLVSMLGVDAGGGVDGMWGSGTMYAGAEKSGLAEITGDAWSHDWRGECSCELGWYIMSVEIGRL